MQIPLYSYIAFNNPDGAAAAIKAMGYKAVNVRSKSDLADALQMIINREGEKMIAELAKVHPDRDLILSATEIKSGADGQQETTKEIAIQQPLPQPKQETNYTALCIAGFLSAAILLSAAIIAKK